MEQNYNFHQSPLSPSIISIHNENSNYNYLQYRIPYLQTKIQARKRNPKSLTQSILSNDSFSYYVQRQKSKAQKAELKTNSRAKKWSLNSPTTGQNSHISKYLQNLSKEQGNKQREIRNSVSRYLKSQNRKKRSQIKRVMSQSKQADEMLLNYLGNIKQKQKTYQYRRYSRYQSNITLPNIQVKQSKPERALNSSLTPSHIKSTQADQPFSLSFVHLSTQFLKERTILPDIYFSYKRQNIYKLNCPIPTIPPKDQLQQFIINYKVINSQIDICSLLKGNFCVVEYSPKQLYIGQMISKHKNGLGILITQKMCFQGLWKNNQKVKGVQITRHGTFKGNFLHNYRHGQGQFQRHNGQIYVGQWDKGKKHGHGLWINQNGQSYNGQWKFDKVQGKGRLTLKQRCYQGYFSNFIQQGFGKESFANGDTFQGIYKGNLPNGKGIYSWRNGSQYIGMFTNGMRHGIGQFHSKEKVHFIGSFIRDRPQGQCQIFLQNKRNYKGTIQYTPISRFEQKMSYTIILRQEDNTKYKIKKPELRPS